MTLMACGGDGEPDAAERDSSSDETELAAFCSAMTTLSSGAVSDPEVLDGVYREIESNAPAEVEKGAALLATKGRALSAAAIQAGAQGPDFDADAFLRDLPLDLRRFVEQLAGASRGEPLSGDVGDLFRYVVSNCP